MLQNKYIIFFLMMAGLCTSLFAAVEATKLKVIVETASVRFKPELSSSVLITLPKGSILEAEKFQDGWYIVSVRSEKTGFLLTGYIHAESVEEIGETKKVVPTQKPRTDIKIPAPPPKKPETPAPETKPDKKAKAVFPKQLYGIKLTGGYVFLYPEEINNAISGRNAFLFSTFQAISPDISISGDPLEIKSGYHIKSSFEICLFSSLYLEAGCEYFRSSKKNEVLAKRIFYNFESSVVDHSRISLIPLTLTLNYHFPLEEGLDFSLFLGAEYGFARYVDSRETTIISGLSESWERREIRASASGLGFHGGFGFSFQLSPSLFFVVEGRGRLMTLKNFDGTVTTSDNTGLSETLEGKLYSYTRWYPHGMYPFVDLFPSAPSEEDDYAVKEAEIGLNSLSFSAGFKIRF
ncbi:MAG: SH3 domain-containing protein [Candidatus Aminicenantes bacterium]|nr:SH3 domain-containing protein [Candidatus Aminicenantes bacterium]